MQTDACNFKSLGCILQIYAGAGGDIALKQPTFSNYAMAAHYYGQTRKKLVVFPFDGVSASPGQDLPSI